MFGFSNGVAVLPAHLPHVPTTRLAYWMVIRRSAFVIMTMNTIATSARTTSRGGRCELGLYLARVGRPATVVCQEDQLKRSKNRRDCQCLVIDLPPHQVIS